MADAPSTGIGSFLVELGNSVFTPILNPATIGAGAQTVKNPSDGSGDWDILGGLYDFGYNIQGLLSPLQKEGLKADEINGIIKAGGNPAYANTQATKDQTAINALNGQNVPPVWGWLLLGVAAAVVVFVFYELFRQVK